MKSLCTCAKWAQHCAGSVIVPYTKQLRWRTIPSSCSRNPLKLHPLSLLCCTFTMTSTLTYTLLLMGAEELFSHPLHYTKQHFHHLCSQAHLNSTISISVLISFTLSFFLCFFIYFVIRFKSEPNLHLVMSLYSDDNPTAEGFPLLHDSLVSICQLSETKRHII